MFFAFIRAISQLTFAFSRLYSRFFAFDFCVFRLWLSFFRNCSPLFALFRIWLSRFSPIFALFRTWLLRFFAFDFRVFSHLTFALFRLYSHYFTFDFRVFSIYLRFFALNCVITFSLALWRLWILRYFAFICVKTPFNSALLRLSLRFNAFLFASLHLWCNILFLEWHY